MHDLCHRRRILCDRQLPDRHGQTEAPRSARSWVEIQHALVAPNVWLVRVPIEYSRKFCRRRVQVNGLHIVQHVKVGPSNSSTSVSGSLLHFPLRSTLPRIAVTGATFSRAFRIAKSPTSPRCKMCPTPSSAGTTSGRRSPCVSLTTPKDIS